MEQSVHVQAVATGSRLLLQHAPLSQAGLNQFSSICIHQKEQVSRMDVHLQPLAVLECVCLLVVGLPTNQLCFALAAPLLVVQLQEVLVVHAVGQLHFVCHAPR